MNLLDAVIILLLITGIAMGIQRGFLRTSLDLIVLVSAAFAGAILYRPISQHLGEWFDVQGAGINALSLILGALGILVILNLIISVAIVPHLLALRYTSLIRVADSGFGVVPGIIYGLLFGAILTLAIESVSFGESVDRALADSDLAGRLRTGATTATSGLAQQTGMDLADFTYVVVPEEESSYRIPPSDSPDLDVAESREAEILDLVNQERVDRGLDSLTWDPSLVRVARGHSREMLELGYFSHSSPNTGMLGDRLGAAGVDYVRAGENLAYAPSVRVAHRGLMQSDGHRANILEPSFQRVGIGVIRGADGTLMVTQVFAR
ncbi:MAG: CvpA family protein [Chloroflexota bacterium]